MSEKFLIRSLLFLSSLCFLAAFILSKKPTSPAEELIEQVNRAQEIVKAQAGDFKEPQNSIYTQAQVAKTEDRLSLKEQESVGTITKMLSQAISQDLSTKTLLQLVRASGLNPVATTNKDPDTGNMTTIRTKNSLEGTRYFHAQFFGGENLKDFPQHISFEIRPSKNSMEVATKMIEENFKGHARLVESRQDYRRWKTDTGQVIWAKALDQDDVQDSPINPRDENDIGAIWVAIEHDIHDDDESHGD